MTHLLQRYPQGRTRPPRPIAPGRVVLVALAVMAALALVAVAPMARSKAVLGGPAASDAGQVRVFRNGQIMGGGTLVDRHWVLTAAHVVPDLADPSAYTMRFGVVNNHDDNNDQSNARTFDRIVPAQGDIALAHFADPVPQEQWIPALPAAAPALYTPAFQFGWAETGGAVLDREPGVVYDTLPAENLASMRTSDPDTAWAFPPGLTPFVFEATPYFGDSGSGVITPAGTLMGFLSWIGPYHHVGRSGNLTEPAYTMAYDVSVYRYRDWIDRTISGEGTSSPPPADHHDGLRGRRLAGAGTSAPLPMTQPPVDPCPSGPPCTGPPPTWTKGVVLGAGNYRGTALARCAAIGGNGCSFRGTATATGTSARMSLGPATAPSAAGTREVIAWCTTTTAFPDATSPARPVVRVSFTNAERDEVQVGYGWWDVTPDQLGTGQGQTLLDTGPLPACP